MPSRLRPRADCVLTIDRRSGRGVGRHARRPDDEPRPRLRAVQRDRDRPADGSHRRQRRAECVRRPRVQRGPRRRATRSRRPAGRPPAGDRIVSFNGAPVDDWDAAAATTIRGPAGAEATVDVVSGDVPRPVNLADAQRWPPSATATAPTGHRRRACGSRHGQPVRAGPVSRIGVRAWYLVELGQGGRRACPARSAARTRSPGRARPRTGRSSSVVGAAEVTGATVPAKRRARSQGALRAAAVRLAELLRRRCSTCCRCCRSTAATSPAPVERARRRFARLAAAPTRARSTSAKLLPVAYVVAVVIVWRVCPRRHRPIRSPAT